MSRKDETTMVLMLLGLAALSLRRTVEWGTGWVWPVPGLRTHDGVLYDAVISDGVGTPRGAGEHRGVDVMFRRRTKGDRPEYRAGTTDGSAMHFAPPMTPIVAARDGTVWSSGNTPRGGTVVLDHGKPWATYYTHLARLAFPSHRDGHTATGNVTHVKAGDIIGWMGHDPLDGAKLRHLHFAVWHGGGESAAVDPADAMRAWQRVPWRMEPAAPGVV
jgi:murein DD-endopeptidase MepM/ murein hydrolase activator NlpD